MPNQPFEKAHISLEYRSTKPTNNCCRGRNYSCSDCRWGLFRYSSGYIDYHDKHYFSGYNICNFHKFQLHSTSSALTTSVSQVSSSSSSPSVSTSSSVPSTSSSSTTQTSSSGAITTLSIDDSTWPVDDLNILWSVFGVPYPNWLADTVYQSLVTVNQTAEFGTGSIQYLPGLAQNWTVSADGTTYTFNMRQNVNFSSGNPLNAYQVWGEMYGFYYLTGNASSWLKGYNLFNMSSVKFGPTTIALMNSSGLITPSQTLLKIMQNSSWPIYVTSSNQIVFRLISPFIYFPGVMLVYQGLIFDTQWLLQHGGFGTPTLFNSNFNQNPIPGTGPYVVSKVAENNYVEFTQNPTYWGNSLTPAQISQQPLFDPGTRRTS